MPAGRGVPYLPLTVDQLPPASRANTSRLKFRHLAMATLSLPLGGFLFCVAWSLKYDFVAATATHCEVANYLPSISAAIGSFSIQRRVWKMAIALQAPSRFLAGYFYHTFWKETLHLTSAIRSLMVVTEILYISEMFGLLGLSFVASVDNFPFHKMSFIVFLTCSEWYMLFTCILFKSSRIRPFTRMEKRSRRYKLGIFLINLLSLVLCMYFYWRHNAYCESGVYTLFALSEYVVVLSNIAFHGTALFDFYDRVLDLSTGTWS